MARSAISFAILFCFVATILLTFVSLSVQAWHKIYLLDANINGSDIRFGVWGYTGNPARIGYTIDTSIPGFQCVYRFPFVAAHVTFLTFRSLNSKTIRDLTFGLALHIVGAVLGAISGISGLVGAAYSKLGTVIMLFSAAVAFVVTLSAWVVDMILWSTVRKHIREKRTRVGCDSCCHSDEGRKG